MKRLYALALALTLATCGPQTDMTTTETSTATGTSTGPTTDGPTTDGPTTGSTPTTGASTGDTCVQEFAEKPADNFSGNNPIHVPLRIEAPAPISLPAGSRIHFVLYGHDRTLADFPATVVRSHVGPIDALPFDFDLPVPNPPHPTIPSDEEDAAYYLIVEIDTNSDDCLAEGDYWLDYDILDKSPRVEFPPVGTLVVPVVEI